MTDLQEKSIELWRENAWELHGKLRAAEDRIEKLEAALRLYACDCKQNDGCGIEYYDGGANCGRTARKALEMKDG